MRCTITNTWYWYCY